MPVVNALARELVFKVVYYGPGLGGKTSSLQFIHRASKPEHRGRMVSLATPVDRTLYFDFLPIRVPNVRNLSVRLQLFTVPGQVYYNATRRLVLTGADGVVFVADSQQARAEANLESMENLRENLQQHGRTLQEVPHVLQYNKRDLPELEAVEALEETLNWYGVPSFATVATSGDGIFESLEAVTREVLEDFERRAPEQASPSSRFEAPEGGLAEALRAARHDAQPEVKELRPSLPANRTFSGELRLQTDEGAVVSVRPESAPILVQSGAAQSGPLETRANPAALESDGVDLSGELGGGQSPELPQASKLGTGELKMGEPPAAAAANNGDDASGSAGEGEVPPNADADSTTADAAMAGNPPSSTSGSPRGDAHGQQAQESPAEGDAAPDSAVGTQPGLGSRPRGFPEDSQPSDGGLPWRGGSGPVDCSGSGSPVGDPEQSENVDDALLRGTGRDTTRPVLPQPVQPTAPSPPSDVSADAPAIPRLDGVGEIAAGHSAGVHEVRIASGSPKVASGVSFAEFWRPPDRGRIEGIERALAEDALAAAIVLIGELVEEELASLGEAVDLPTRGGVRDTRGLCSLLGVDGRRYLELLLMLKQASLPHGAPQRRSAMDAYLFAVELHRAVGRLTLR